MANSFFWLKWVDKIFLRAFWWVFLMAIIFFVPFLRVWWWVFFPLFLAVELRILYLWWIHWDFAYAKKKWIMLEVIPPKEVLVPLKAMDDIFTVMWGVHLGPSNWREVWCEGELKEEPYWMSWEIASIEGNLHFYMRVMADKRGTLETALYGHYPELEIREVQDYTKNVPQNIPNAQWDVYGEDFILGKSSAYPIRTYKKFFEPQGEKISAEEKRIDPMSSLLELMSKLGPGEQFWLQFITQGTDGKELKAQADEVISKISKRPVKHKKSMLDDTTQMLFHIIFGPGKEGAGEKASYKWLDSKKTELGEDKELLLTPGERETLTEIENKLKRPVFRTTIRGVYVAKRENFNPAHKFLTRSYFAHFYSQNLNFMKFSGVTRPKTQYFFRKSIPFIRVRRQFRNYVQRFTPLFPDRKQEMPLLNTEEMATLYHFPLKITGLVAPTMARVESKKGGPPPNLPVEVE